MHEISCPHCGRTFNVDEAGYAEILSQVRNEAFEKDLHDRLELAEQEKKTAIELAEAKVAGKLKEEAAEKDLAIERLEQELKSSVELAQAKATAYRAVEKLHFDGAFCRRDIGDKGLKREGK